MHVEERRFLYYSFQLTFRQEVFGIFSTVMIRKNAPVFFGVEPAALAVWPKISGLRAASGADESILGADDLYLDVQCVKLNIWSRR